MAKARMFECLECNADDFMTSKDAVRALLGEPNTERDESDQRHLARTIASDSTVFVTRDEPVLRIADDIYDQHGLSIVRPAQLVARFEELRNESDYQRARLAGSPIQFRRASTDATRLAEQFQAQTSGERRHELAEQLNTAFAHPDRFECRLVETNDHRPMALHIAERLGEKLLSVPVFRVSKNFLNTRLTPTLARTLLSGIVQDALRAGIHVVRLTDQHLKSVVTNALQLSGFFRVGDSWLKLSVTDADTVEGVAQRIAKISQQAGIEDSVASDILDVICDSAFSTDENAILDMEHTLWPGKFIGCDITNFIVPIRPRWASDLFDAG